MARRTQTERDRLVLENMRLVYHIVRKMCRDTENFDDHVQNGTIGLMHAAETYDPERGITFGSYAGKCIVNDVLKGKDVVSGVSCTVRKRRAQIIKARDALWSELGRWPVPEEIAEAIGVGVDVVERAERMLSRVDLDEQRNAVASGDVERDCVLRSEASAVLAAADHVCTKPTWRAVFELRIVGGKKLRDVGDEIGLTGERVRQLERTIKQRIRDRLAEVA